MATNCTCILSEAIRLEGLCPKLAEVLHYTLSFRQSEDSLWNSIACSQCGEKGQYYKRLCCLMSLRVGLGGNFFRQVKESDVNGDYMELGTFFKIHQEFCVRCIHPSNLPSHCSFQLYIIVGIIMLALYRVNITRMFLGQKTLCSNLVNIFSVCGTNIIVLIYFFFKSILIFKKI